MYHAYYADNNEIRFIEIALHTFHLQFEWRLRVSALISDFYHMRRNFHFCRDGVRNFETTELER